jgi:hypothetical protein
MRSNINLEQIIMIQQVLLGYESLEQNIMVELVRLGQKNRTKYYYSTHCFRT